MEIMEADWQSPSAAWASVGLCIATAPVCIYPIFVTVRERLRQYPQGHAVHLRPRTASTSHGTAPHFSNWFTLAFWLSVTVCHIGLLLYSVLAAAETSDDCYGEPPDRGWATPIRRCLKAQVVSVVDLSEVVLMSVYPITLLNVYVELNSSSSAMSKTRRKWRRRTFTLMVCIVGLLTGFLFFTTAADRIPVYTPVESMTPQLRATHRWGAEWQSLAFDVWFAVLVLSAVAALALTIRLLPHLRARDKLSNLNTGKSQSQSLGQQLNSGPPSLVKTGSTFSSTLKLVTPLSVLHLPSSSTLPSVASARLRRCIRRLWAILLVVSLVLLVNVLIVAGSLIKSVAHVTSCVSGWISCHVISMAFFSAKRIVREAVIARRQLPSEVGVGTVVTEWREAGESLSQN